MQRQLYLALFVTVAALAVVAVMRPNVAEELATLGRLGIPGFLGQAVGAPPDQAPADSSGNYAPRDPLFSAPPPVSWAESSPPGNVDEAGESFVSDLPSSSRPMNGYRPAPQPPIGYPRVATPPASSPSAALGYGTSGQTPLDLRSFSPPPVRYQPPVAPSPQIEPPAAAWMGQEPSAAPRFDSFAAPRRYEPAATAEPYAEAGIDRTGDRMPRAAMPDPSRDESFPMYPPANRPFSAAPSTPPFSGMANQASPSAAAIQAGASAGSPIGYRGSSGSFDGSMASRVPVAREVDQAANPVSAGNWWDIDELRAEEEASRRRDANSMAGRDRTFGETALPGDSSVPMTPGPASNWAASETPASRPWSEPVQPPIAGPAASPTPGFASPAATEPTGPPAASGLASRWQPPRSEVLQRAPDPPPTSLFENAQILARVGSHVILACEVLPLVDRVMEENKDKFPPSVLEEQRELLIEKLLDQRIEMKLIYSDAQRSLPPEAITNIEKHLSKQFEEEEIPKRLEKAELGSRLELQRELEKIGSSLEREKQSFIERAIAQQWVFQQIGDEKEVTHEDILQYYHEHAADFEHPARARWEQLTVRFSLHPDPGEARAVIAQMGNEVMRGRPFADVAREHSEGSTAEDGGARDWTIRGSLRSEGIDRALFGLPVGELSPILEDEQGLHILRVVEREEANRTSFIEAQVEIKEKLRQSHRKEQMDVFTERLRKEIPVWTAMDEQVADRRASESSRPPAR